MMETIPLDAPIREAIPEGSLCKDCAWLASWNYANHCKKHKQKRELTAKNRYITLDCSGYEKQED